ncbi:MAG TPA: DUF6519 domain-containing protein [Kofleriaceae bacterium]|nr:DUF6519 domain-containing protein [Kofleriaceae bacterium]
MASEDISRSAFYPAKRFRGVRMQQGRVLTDDDWNSGDDIAADDIRQTRLHVIGAAGSPDSGFQISDAIVDAGGIDFELAAGTYYVSGHRVTLAEAMHYAAQPDWLDQPPSEPPAPTGARTDFVYLEVWEQPVTAIEDEELFEKALGGPDTTTRRRLMARVRVLAGVDADDCQVAWDELAENLAGADAGSLDESGELKNDLLLQVTYGEGGDPSDLCTPQVTAGYLGAENQAIRVQLMDGNLVWGLDDAAPPYRATIDAAGETITFLTQPKDAVHWPLAGQTLEILRPAAVLANGEVLAAVKGHVTTLASSYDPTTAQVTLNDPHPDGGELAGLDHVYVRMWRRGTDVASPATTPVVPGTAMVLGNTGITVTVTGDDLAADAFWVIAVRPETPDQVVPWALEDGRAANGIKRFFAPLGMLWWTALAGGASEAEIEDCRPPFAPLTAQRGCCRYTVGDGTTSHGQFDSIREAINALPGDGGEICLLPGTWTENVVIESKANITVHGCRARSIVTALDPEVATFAIRGSNNIRLEHFAVENREGIAVQIESGPPPAPDLDSGDVIGSPTAHGIVSDRITLDDLDLTARDQSAVLALAVTHFSMTGCRVTIEALISDVGDGDTGAYPAVFLLVRDALVEGNQIATTGGHKDGGDVMVLSHPVVSAGTVPSRTALGGLQLAGQSQRVDVLRNHITGGLGNGITLGSVRWTKAAEVVVVDAETNPELAGEATVQPNAPFSGANANPVFVATYVVTDCCPENTPTPPGPTDENGDSKVPSSDGDLADIRIIDNEIAAMGASGIGVARFFELSKSTELELIHVDRLTIENNRIHDCVWLELAAADPDLTTFSGWGGISLASAAALMVRANHIANNGAMTADPSCGVFALWLEQAAIDRNQIIANGRPLTASDALKAGYRGGVVIGIAETADEDDESGQGLPAVRITGNVVASPDGRALWINAIGAAAIEGNHLSVIGRGQQLALALAEVNDSGTSLASAGDAVSLINLGRATDLSDTDSDDTQRAGLTLFNDNQVVLDLDGAEQGVTTSSILLYSLDDLGVDGNQSAVEMPGDSGPKILFNLMAGGETIRVTDNRFKERLGFAQLSAYTSGLLNTTTDNQGTHCFQVVGLPNGRVDAHNQSWFDVLTNGGCAKIAAAADLKSQEVGDRFAKDGRFSIAPGSYDDPHLVKPLPPAYERDPLSEP